MKITSRFQIWIYDRITKPCISFLPHMSNQFYMWDMQARKLNNVVWLLYIIAWRTSLRSNKYSWNNMAMQCKDLEEYPLNQTCMGTRSLACAVVWMVCWFTTGRFNHLALRKLHSSENIILAISASIPLFWLSVCRFALSTTNFTPIKFHYLDILTKF